jgi:hypothetical protein
MKIIITGGRDYADYIMVHDIIESLNPELIIQGGCPTGADRLAMDSASELEIDCITYEADWNKYGKSAGPIRNKLMCSENTSAIVIAFPGGKGTENCIQEAVKLNMLVMRVV